MPQHTVNLVLKALRDANKQPEGSNIVVLGTAHKANVEDMRLSPSESIIQKLRIDQSKHQLLDLNARLEGQKQD
jgi:UDP-N-acetyl-D-glucosamine dehydrogenase